MTDESHNHVLSRSHTIPPGQGFSFRVSQGEIIRITDLEGQQVTDLLAFDAGNLTHRFSRAQTKKLNANIWISVGGILYSNTCKPMLRVIADTVGKHDMQFSPCGPEDNLIRFGQRGVRTCIENFLEVLTPYGIQRDAMNEPFGIFFNMRIDENGNCQTHPPISKEGDFIEFEVCTDCIIGLSACPQLLNGCNGNKLSPIKVEVFVPSSTTTDS